MTKEEVVLVAVQWWSDKLMSYQPHSNGDNSMASAFACMFADIMAKYITKEQIDIFEEALTNLLNVEYDRWFNKYGCKSFSISCDYGPDTQLRAAAAIAGINLNNFPYKTAMLITKDGVSVKDGYGRPFVELKV